jgi:hypothetical protein
VTVSEFQHPDLYWALRGAGGGNFGVITSFVVQTFPQGPIYSGSRTWNETYTEEAIDEIYDLHTTHDNDEKKGLDAYYGYDPTSGRFTLAASLRYFYPVENPPVFESISRIPTVAASQRIANLGRLSGPGSISATAPPIR